MTSSSVDALSQCWSSIVPYVDVESLISVSKSCHPLRDQVVDSDTGKLKASVVNIYNWRNVADAYNSGEINTASAPARVPHYVPQLINATDFSYLAKLTIGFPRERTSFNGSELYVENAHTTVLPMLAIKLKDATNLEELSLDINSLVLLEEKGGLSGIWAMLGENLARAISRNKKFRKLTLFNQGTLEDGVNSKFSGAFLAAMVPVLQASLHSLEHVTVLCGDISSSSDHPNAGKDFFMGILQLTKLKVLQLQLCTTYGPLWDDLIDASATLGAFHSDTLETISVVAPRSAEVHRQLLPTQPHSKIAPFLSLLCNVSTLGTFMLRVPPECWGDGSTSELRHVFNGNPALSTLFINFYGYVDTDDRLLGYLVTFLEKKTSLSGLQIILQSIGDVDKGADSFLALQRYRCPRNGVPILRESETHQGMWNFEL